MDSQDCRKKRAKKNLKQCESSYVREPDSSDDEKNQDDISKFKFHFSSILGDIKQNIDEQFVKLEKCFNHAILDLRAETEELRSDNTLIRQKLDALEEKVLYMSISQTQFGDKINNHERFSRKNNIRILGMRFSPNENCISKSTEYLSNLLQRDVKIEQAHRDGRAPTGKDRHILVRCSFYQDKCDILKAAKASFRCSHIYIIEDLTPLDLKEKKKWSANVSKLYKDGVKLRFRNGKWRQADGAPYKFE